VDFGMDYCWTLCLMTPGFRNGLLLEFGFDDVWISGIFGMDYYWIWIAMCYESRSPGLGIASHIHRAPSCRLVRLTYAAHTMAARAQGPPLQRKACQSPTTQEWTTSKPKPPFRFCLNDCCVTDS